MTCHIFVTCLLQTLHICVIPTKYYGELLLIFLEKGSECVVLLNKHHIVFLIQLKTRYLLLMHNSYSKNIVCVIQFRTAAKATVILFPVLGINNLIFLYVPSGDYEKYYVILNTFLSSSQVTYERIPLCHS